VMPGRLRSVDGEVVGARLPEGEAYVGRRELARLMGVSVDTVDRLRRDGMPSVTWGRRMVRFKPSVALQWAREHRGEAA